MRSPWTSAGVFLCLVLSLFSCAPVLAGAGDTRSPAIEKAVATPAAAPEYEYGPTRESIVAHELEGDLLEVHFLDVGQGDGTLIKTPGGKYMMVDVGTRSSRRRTIPYLKKLGVEKLDILLTHSHADHAGALIYFLEAFEVGTLYSPGYFHSAKFIAKALKKAEEKGVKLVTVKRGARLEPEEGFTIKVMHPPEEWDLEVENLNNISVVTQISYGEIDFLLTGDAEKKAEKTMLKAKLDLRSEFLKLGHHGSKTATTERFLDRVLPLFGVVSCGVKNMFKHPHPETMQRLKVRDIAILRTDEAGTIIVSTDGKKVMIKVMGKETKPVSFRFRHPSPGHTFIILNQGGVHAC